MDEDYDEAERHYRLGAYHGDTGAYIELALGCLDGVEVDRDPDEAVRLLKKAVSCRNVDGYSHDLLGIMYLFGEDDVDQDIDQAIIHFKRSSDFGFAPAQCLLGGIYSGHFGNCNNRKDMSKAIRYYRLAASNGDIEACVRMGIFLRDGRGVTKDLREAIALFRKAADSGHTVGIVLLGLCYQRGEGVEKDLSEAMRLFREVEV